MRAQKSSKNAKRKRQHQARSTVQPTATPQRDLGPARPIRPGLVALITLFIIAMLAALLAPLLLSSTSEPTTTIVTTTIPTPGTGVETTSTLVSATITSPPGS